MKNKKSTLNLFILFSLLVAVCWSLYVLLYKKTESLFNESEEVRGRVAVASAKNNELELVRKDIKAAQGDYQKIQNIFLPKEEVVDFIQTLESLGRMGGVAVKIDSVKNEELSPPVTDKEHLTLLLSAVGSRSQVLRFLNLLEHLPHKVTFNSVLLGKGDATTIEREGHTKTPADSWFLSTNISVVKLK